MLALFYYTNYLLVRMKTIYITNEQKYKLKTAINEEMAGVLTLLNEENRTQKKKAVDGIRQYCNPFIVRYLDTPLRELPMDIQQGFNGGPNEGSLFKAVADNTNGCNRTIDFLRLNLYRQFGLGRNSSLFNYIEGIVRISCGELGFYSFDPGVMQGGKIVKFGKVLKLIDKKPEIMMDGITIDGNLNDLNYSRFMTLFKKQVKQYVDKSNEDLDSDTSYANGTDYQIIEIQDRPLQGGGSVIYQPTPESMDFLRSLHRYTDWCICGQMGAQEYSQYVSSGGKFYICLKEGFENIEKKPGPNCPLDEYGLSMIAVVVGTDGLPDNVTTRWNHDFGGENHSALWEAYQIQKVTKINFREKFKPRDAVELNNMHINEDNVPAAQDQVGKKVNAGIMDAVTCGGMCEEGAEPESDEYGIGFEGNSAMNYGHVNESIDEQYDYKKDMLSIARFMKDEGLNVYPFPKVKLNWEEQDGLFIKTGYYQPESKTIVVFCKDRHPKDILRTYAHEMIHHSQNLDGKNLNFSSNDDVKDNEELEKIEGEAYLKGNVYFRKWTEHKHSKECLNESIIPDLRFGININIDEQDWLQLIFDGEKTVETRDGKTYSQWKQHEGETVGLVKTTSKPSKNNPTGMLVGYATIEQVISYNKDDFFKDNRHKVSTDSQFGKNGRCGLLLTDVHKLDSERKLVGKGQRAVRPIEFADLSESIDPSDVDLSSFNIKKNLNPKFWKDERLDSRVRMKLLDIADDFVEFLGVDWVKPEDVIMTGSLANFNWDKKFSDIDLHILIDYSKVDKRKDFVDNYFYSQKKLWNDEHKDLKIFGFPIEVYVQDVNEKHNSTGVYSLDKDKWIREPEREKLAKAKVNKSYIKDKVSEYVDKIDNLLTIYKKHKDDEYEVRKVSEDAEKIFDDIKKERSKGLSGSNSEISNGNVIFKSLRRMGYIEKIVDLKSKAYDNLNSLS